MEPTAVAASVDLDRSPGLPVDARVTASPVPLYLWLWGRGPREQIGIEGGEAAVEQLHARMRLAIQ